MKGLTAKVFRTYNASHTFQVELKSTPKNANLGEKVLAFNRSNRQVAILCNHQKSVSKGHDGQMKKMRDKILAVIYQRIVCREKIYESGATIKLPDTSNQEKEITDEWIADYLEIEAENNAAKLKKQFEKDSEKRKENGEEQISWDEFLEKKNAPKKSKTVDGLLKEYERLTARLEQYETAIVDKDEGKTTALGTSKQNYIDPRITVAWCKTHDVPIEKMLNKTLREKFKWALTVDKDWEF
eukprot:NODE_33_length_36935_cov_1.609241.p22 type:complete len:241 gc:universal NODE_33_length_36935_cov_1.609241:1058-336(-)